MNIDSSVVESLITLYSDTSDKYHQRFLDEIHIIIPDRLLDLYIKTINLSIEALFDEEYIENYQLALALLLKELGYTIDTHGKLHYKGGDI